MADGEVAGARRGGLRCAGVARACGALAKAVGCSRRTQRQKAASGPTVQHAVPDVRRDLVLIRDPRRAASRHPARVGIRSGDAVFLRSHSLGRYLDVQGEAVRAHWRQRAPLQQLTLESDAGGAISSGDQVHLRALSGIYLEVGDRGLVSATGQGRGARSALTVHKRDALASQGQILVGDLLHFVAHLPQGQKQLGLDHVHGVVHARWADQRGDEVFVVEAEDMPMLQRPCGVRLVAESTKSEREWALSCVHLEADVGVLAPGGQLQDGGPCSLVQSGSPVAEAPRVFGPTERYLLSRGRHAVSATGGVFHLGVACQTPLPVHTVRFVQADGEHAAETVLLQEQVAGGAWRTVCRHRAQPAGVVDALLEPVGVVGFEDNAAWDARFGAGFLGSGYDLTDIGSAITVAMPVDLGPPLSFRNATAALAAMKFWEQRQYFTELDREEADVLSRNLGCLGSAQQHYDDIEGSSFGGIFASEWTAMMGVHRAKFCEGSILASALLQTGDTFLLAHSSAATGTDSFWSDNGDGEGNNLLGMQLMLLRDELAVPPRGGPNSWTEFISELYDVSTGMALAKEACEEIWQNLVRDARDALLAQAFPETNQPRRNVQGKDDGQPTFLQTLAMSLANLPVESAPSKPGDFYVAAPAKYSKSNKMSLAHKGHGHVVGEGREHPGKG